MPSRTVILALALTAASQTGAQTAGSRVEEEASRPMRMILEAAKIKGRAKPAEAPPAPAKPAAAAPRAASGPLTTPVAARPSPQLAPVALPAAAPDGTPQSTVTTVEADAAPRAAVPEGPPASRAAPEAEPIENLPPLKLLAVVEPITPRALVGRLQGEVRVHVAFTVAADGSVTQPSVRSSSHPRMNAAVLEAVGQWRYQPISGPREHAVQVVLRPGT